MGVPLAVYIVRFVYIFCLLLLSLFTFNQLFVYICLQSSKSFSTESNPAATNSNQKSSQNPNKNHPENLAETGSVVNKGWNFISSAFTASSNFKSNSSSNSKFDNSQLRARSRDSLFPTNHNSLQGSLDIPSIKTRSEKIISFF